MKYKIALGAFATCAALALSSFQPDSADNCKQTTCNLLKVMEDIPTAQAFLKDPIPEADLQRIVNAGVNAPSAMNKQPWHFTVISNPTLIQQLADAQKESMKNMKFPPMPPKDAPANGDRPQMPPMNGEHPDMPPMGKGEHPEMPPMANGERPKMPPMGKGPKSGLGDSPVVIIISCTESGEFDAGLACECMNDMANLMGYGTKIASSVKMLFDGANKEEYYAQFQIPEGQHIVTAILVGKINTEAYDVVTSATPRNPQAQVVTFLK